MAIELSPGVIIGAAIGAKPGSRTPDSAIGSVEAPRSRTKIGSVTKPYFKSSIIPPSSESTGTASGAISTIAIGAPSVC